MISQCHQNHQQKIKLVTECYPDHHQEIEDNLATVKNKVDEINTALTNLVTQKGLVTEQGQNAKKKIHAQAQLIIKLVQESETQLVQQADAAVQREIHLLTNQEEQAGTAMKQLEVCENFVVQSLKNGSQQEILRGKQNMIQKMTRVAQDVKPFVFLPIEEEDITFTSNQKMVGKFEGIGKLKTKMLSKVVFDTNACYHGKKSTITLNLQTHDGYPFTVPVSLISCEISPTRDSQLIPCDVSEIKLGSYKISFNSCIRGTLQLLVRVGGFDIPGSPFPLFAKVGGKPVENISGLSRPWGVAVTKDEQTIVVENRDNRITILNKEGNKVKSFGTKGRKDGEFTNPRGVAVTDDGHVLVTDEHRLQKLTLEGDCVKTVGSGNKGNGPLQFNCPQGITIHPITGQIFIADQYNHRIQVLNNDLTHSHSFGTKGLAPEQFDNPYDVAFDKENNLYVVDRYNHCIKKLTPTGQYISQFGSSGSNPGQVKNPTSITIDNNNLVYVSEYGNHRVSIFDTNGCVIHNFGKKGSGEEEYNYPCGITIDSLGYLYVSDTYNNRLVVL